MGEYISKFFDTSDFPARWYCGNWSEFLGWLHIASDIAVCAAYFAIPAVLIHFARRKRDFPFSKLFWLFAGFIFACGTVHLIEAIIFWYPHYRLSGFVKFLTAVISWVTVIMLFRYAPRAMALPSLSATNERLKSEMVQREKSERDLQKLKRRYEALLEGTRSIIWTTDASGGFAIEQPSWQRYTGQRWDQYKNNGWIDAVLEDDRAELLRRWSEARETYAKYQATARLWNHASQSYRRCVTEAVPVFNDDDTIAEWVGTVSDVEDQSQAEFALGIAQNQIAKQKEELELIYESAPIGMSLLDRDFKFLRINQTLARINGFSREKHIGRSADEILNAISDEIKLHYEQVFKSGEPLLDVEIVGKRPIDSQERIWLASYYPLKSQAVDHTNGQLVTAVSAIVQDITDRKRQEQRLRESEQLALAASQSKSEFLANMSHEIRTPMAAILGYADVLLGHLKDPDNRSCVLVVKKNGEFLLELINDILDLSRIEAGKMSLDRETIDFPRLIAEVRTLMLIRASEKPVDFLVHFDSDVPAIIRTDPVRLRQVLINLVGNAIKFTEKGSVTLSICLADEDPSNARMQFNVKDTGIGMREDQLDKLFKPFSQGDSSVTRSFGGSGLGLAISKRLVDLLCGTITAESKLGVGSTFTVELPIGSIVGTELVRPESSSAPDDAAEAPKRDYQLNCRVLVVDDRRDVRHISQHFLEKAGASVDTAEDGQQGIDAVQKAIDDKKPYDIIVMDMQMPKVDGLQATTKLRSLGVQTPIIALTADAMMGDREKCLAGGCDDYMSKPIDHAVLIEKIHRYARGTAPTRLRAQRTRSNLDEGQP